MYQNTGVIIAAGIGAVTGLGGSRLMMLFQSRLEKTKWLRVQGDAKKKELQETIEQFNTKLATAIHLMIWLAWVAKVVPNRMSQNKVEQYEKEINSLLSEITALRISVMSLDGSLTKAINSLSNVIYGMDAAVSKAGFLFERDPAQCIKELSVLYDRIVSLENEVPHKAVEIIKKTNTEFKIS